MIYNSLKTAILAGIVAGLFVTFAQMVRVVPLIYEAETYERAESGAAEHDGAAERDDAAESGAVESGAAAMATGDASAEAPGPENGVARFLYTALSNLVTATGFGLMLCAGFILGGRRLSMEAGLLWGIAGFLTFSLLPAIGLPPELPGTKAADLEARQVWWLATVICSGGGLAMIAFSRRWPLKGLGALLLALPHLVGAPQPEVPGGTVPPSLAAEFAIASIVTSALFWIVLGTFSGWLFGRFEKTA